MNFNEFCENYCDGLYNSKLPEESQCNGYILLKKMVKENIEPASLEEYGKWSETISNIELKYLTFLHVNLRILIIENWEKIKKLKL